MWMCLQIHQTHFNTREDSPPYYMPSFTLITQHCLGFHQLHITMRKVTSLKLTLLALLMFRSTGTSTLIPLLVAVGHPVTLLNSLPVSPSLASGGQMDCTMSYVLSDRIQTWVCGHFYGQKMLLLSGPYSPFFWAQKSAFTLKLKQEPNQGPSKDALSAQ